MPQAISTAIRTERSVSLSPHSCLHMVLLRTLSLMLFVVITGSSTVAQWTRMPGPEGGRFMNVVTMGTHIFAFSAGRELYRSTDQGETWTLRCRWIETRGPDPLFAVRDSTLYAGTENRLYRSVDSGMTWSVILPYRIHALGVTTDGMIVAGTNLTLSSHALQISTDGGNTWMPSDSGLTSNVFSMTFQGDTMFVGTSKRGVFRSTDAGKTWQPTNTGLPDDGYGTYVSFSAVHMRDSIVLASSERGFFRSTDAGAHWATVTGLISSNATILTEARGELIAAGYGVFASTDGGATWSARYAGLTSLWVRGVGENDTSLVAATSDGMFRSTDRGISWHARNNGLACARIGSIAFVGERMIVSTGKAAFSDDHGTTWQGFTETVLHGVAISDFTSYGADIFARNAGSGALFRSTDSGKSWQAVAVTAHLIAAASECDTLVAIGAPYGTEIVYRSTDRGATWTTGVNLGFLNCGTMCFIGRDVFVLTLWGRVIRSTDMGDTWLEAAGGLDPNTMRPRAIVACGTDIFLGTSGLGVLRSTNHGASWTAVNNGMPFDAPGGYVLEVTALAAIGNTVFAATDGGGVSMTSDRGEHWAAINDELFAQDIITLTIHSGNIYAGTEGMGIWWRPLSEVTAIAGGDHIPLPSHVALEQNFPNPFNPNTTIRYALPRATNVQISVYDILGREVVVLVREQKPAGEHEVTFDASSFHSGVYFCRLTAHGAIRAVRMLLLK